MADLDRQQRVDWHDHAEGFHLNLFGEFTLRAPDGTVVGGLSRKARGIIAFLALTDGFASRNDLTTLLWSDRAFEQARASLRQACYEIRHALPATTPPVIVFGRDEIAIDRRQFVTDIDTVADAHTGLITSDPARALLLRDLTALSSSFDSWLAGERVRRADARRVAMHEIAQSALAARRWIDAQQIAMTLLAYDARDHDAAQIATHALSQMGEGDTARHLYVRHASALRRDLAMPRAKTVPPPGAVAKGEATSARSMPPAEPAPVEGAATPVDLLADLPILLLKPSIAVMPFANLSNDPEQDYFAEGIVEEIVASLARFKSLFVIAAGANLLANGQLISPQDAARRLGVRYLLKGSVRKASERIRITVHLVEAVSGMEVWTDTLDDMMADIFALQDRVAEYVAGVLETTVQDQDILKASERPTANMNSYDFYLRSMQHFRLSRKDDMRKSIDLLDRAIELDPTYAVALSQSCVCHRQMVDHGWADDIEQCRRRGLELVERALAVAGTDARVLAQVAASLPGLEGGMDRANRLVERAIALNPSSSFVWLISGSLHLRNGQPDIAAAHLETSMRLDAISSSTNAYSRMYMASARFQQGRFDEAMTLFETTSLRLPVSYIILASLYGYLGKPQKTVDALSHFRSLSEISIENLTRIFFWRPQYRRLLMHGITLADRAISKQTLMRPSIPLSRFE